MTVNLSERQRCAIFVRLMSMNDWGGSADALVARSDAWEALRLGEFDGKPIKKDALKTAPEPFDLPQAVIDHLLWTVPAGQFDTGLALDLATVVKALRTVPAP